MAAGPDERHPQNVTWLFVGLALWALLSVPIGLLAGAAIRGRTRPRRIDLRENTSEAASSSSVLLGSRTLRS